jgi:NADPH:quinone reductase
MIPERMQAVQCEQAGRPLVARAVPTPRPANGEVLIRMAAAPINPSDLGFLNGLPTGSFPATGLGHEASGTVVAAGGGMLGRLLVGRRVAYVLAQGGTWAEYAVAPSARCIPLMKYVSFEQGAMLIVNPLTAVAFFEFVKRGRHTAVVSNAAASALGRMIIRLGHRTGIPVLNIVRREEQVTLLHTLGVEHVLNSRDHGFAAALRALAARFHATLVFDAVGGAGTQTLVEAVPAGSTIIVYAALAGEPSVFDARALAVGDKKIEGFFLANWMACRGKVSMVRDLARVQRLIGTDLQTSVQQRFPLSAAQAAVDAYRSNMTAGKVLMVDSEPSR